MVIFLAISCIPRAFDHCTLISREATWSMIDLSSPQKIEEKMMMIDEGSLFTFFVI